MVISVINYKGGVGKTTFTLNIGSGLAKFYSKKVLLVDIDPQTNLTLSIFNFRSWKNIVEKTGSIKDLFEAFINRDISYSLRNVIVKNPISVKDKKLLPNIDLVPSHLGMILIDVHLAKSFSIVGEFDNKFEELWEHKSVLNKGLRSIKSDYDFILIDCPPNFNTVTQNAIFASDYFIVPTIPDYLSVLGVRLINGLVKEINDIGRKTARKLHKNYRPAELLGIGFNRVKMGSGGPVNLHNTQMNQIRDMYDDKVFENYITDSISIAESSSKYLPIYEYNDSKAGHSKEQFAKLTQEVKGKVDKLIN